MKAVKLYGVNNKQGIPAEWVEEVQELPAGKTAKTGWLTMTEAELEIYVKSKKAQYDAWVTEQANVVTIDTKKERIKAIWATYSVSDRAAFREKRVALFSALDDNALDEALLIAQDGSVPASLNHIKQAIITILQS